MASKKNSSGSVKTKKKKTSIGQSSMTKNKQPGTHGGNRGYKKRYRGQGK
jgi:hypothetical protein|tara:strand:+ start:387 stop:536 length:150 start_codon:yes stop_codon:yes gene_type:complete